VISKKDPKVRDMVIWLSDIEANNEGADTNDLSGRQVDSDSSLEYLPKGGYSAFIKALSKQSKGKIHLNERVVKIDYSKKLIHLTTSTGKTYFAKRVISSLPLGVLKAGSVKFQPPLSEKYQRLIQKIGVGNLNKLFVSF
jgi:polyamine oxidase